MTGVVHVLALSKPLPHTQEFYDDEAEAQRRALLTDADAVDGEGSSGHQHGSGHQVIAGGGRVPHVTSGATQQFASARGRANPVESRSRLSQQTTSGSE